ncbi:MAG: biopolymer transporter ExbD [Planctomycetaceae bacterium]|nr:biopolymer transporter ExbD [Planctomycetaceae bacterium]
MRFQRRTVSEPLSLKLVSAIDIVFLLLIFFLLSFRIRAEEGDFPVNLPMSQCFIQPGPDGAIHVFLASHPDGRLKSLHLGERDLGDQVPDCFERLNQEIAAIVGQGAFTDELHAEIHTDEELAYRHVVKAISACRGTVLHGRPIAYLEDVRLVPSP